MEITLSEIVFRRKIQGESKIEAKARPASRLFKEFKLERCGWNNVFLESRSDRDFGVKMSVTFFGRQNVEYLLLLYQTCHQQLTFS